jgi:hypothetical protein
MEWRAQNGNANLLLSLFLFEFQKEEFESNEKEMKNIKIVIQPTDLERKEIYKGFFVDVVEIL